MAEEGETRVLICMDGSKYCDYAFDWYLKNIKKSKDYVILFHSVEFHTLTTMHMEVGSVEALSRSIEEEKAAAQQYFQQLTDRMKSAHLHGKVKQTTGPPRTEITRVAEEEKVDMIIMGTRGMGKVKRTFLGSVSDHVLHHSHVPVIICRHKDDHHPHQHGEHAQTELHGKVKQTTGAPRTEIIRVAEEERVDMVVMGTRGMGKVKRTFMGSVSDHVLHHAHVPVIICKHKDDHHPHHHHEHAQTEVKV